MADCSVVNTSSFGNCLADLSISELLILKHSLKRIEVTEEIDENSYLKELNGKCAENSDGICEKPSSLALVAEQRGYEEAHPNYETWHPEEKPSKLQTLFHISVTALAFLSFGGYLLCLIVQSIRSKGSTYFHPATSTMATTNGVKRIKVYRRSRRSSVPPIESTQIYNSYDPQYNYHTNNPYQYYQRKDRSFN